MFYVNCSSDYSYDGYQMYAAFAAPIRSGTGRHIMAEYSGLNILSFLDTFALA